MRYVVIILITLLSVSAISKPYTFPWKTAKKQILKKHKLNTIEIAGLQNNLTKFLGIEESDNFRFYLLIDDQGQKHCDVEMFTIMGFYSDSLIFFSLATEEMTYSKEDKIGDCLREKLFGKDNKMMWKPIWKTNRQDGDIFGEGGMFGFGQVGSDYVVDLLSLGIVSRPTHRQHTMFYFDKSFLDSVMAKLRIHDDHRKYMHPTEFFIVYHVDEFERLQKPVEDKK